MLDTLTIACSTRAPSWRRLRSAWQRFLASKRRWSAFAKPGSRIGSRSRAYIALSGNLTDFGQGTGFPVGADGRDR